MPPSHGGDTGSNPVGGIGSLIRGPASGDLSLPPRYRRSVDDVRAFVDACQAFFSHLAAVSWTALVLAVALHLLKLVLRVRAWQNILRASYPATRVRYRDVFGAYLAGVGVNSIAPARGGDLVKLYLVKRRVPGSTYPTLGSTLIVETLFDAVVAGTPAVWAIQQGVLPGVPDLPRLPAFDWTSRSSIRQQRRSSAASSWPARSFSPAGRPPTSSRCERELALGFVALKDAKHSSRGVVSWQAASWVARFAAVYFFLRAFHIEATLGTVLTVLVVQSLSTLLPFTPGGAGAQQAVLVFALAGSASTSALLSFSVGMQVATVLANVVVGFGAIALILRTLNWRSRVRADNEAATAEAAAAPEPSVVRSPRGPPA